MIKFDIITIFPRIFDSFLKESLIFRGQKKKLIKINVHNLRKWASDKHKTVDDRPFGGGLGMVMKVEPIFKAVTALKKSKIQNSNIKLSLRSKVQKSKVILFTPRGKKFNQKIAYQLSKMDQLILICGRYEGVDERVAKNIADMKLSIGDYDLMGGELAAMVLIETVSRLVPGLIGKEEFLKQRITKEKGFIEYPQYTRPEVFCQTPGVRKSGTPGVRKAGVRKDIGEKKMVVEAKCWRVPKVLLSGNHKKIEEWRKKHAKIIGK